MKVEYRVRKITRYIVTRYYETEGGHTGGCEERGQYDNEAIAFEVATALARHEHHSLGYPPGDERIQYPRRPSSVDAECEDVAYALADDLIRGA